MAYQANKAAKTASKARRNAATNAALIEVQIQYRAVGDLVLDPRNPRQHSKRQVNQIADSIREFGFVMPVVIDDTGQVVIGHGRVLAAKKLGMLRIPVVEIRHLSKAQLKGLRIADNRLAQHAQWDDRLLGESFRTGESLASGSHFTPSPTARRVHAQLSVRARSARRGARVDKSRPCVA